VDHRRDDIGGGGASPASTARPREQDYFLLRAEWLRFKNHVFDANTELPTLAAVLDDVRRLMEERGTLGLIYVDVGSEGRLETVNGWYAYDEVLRAFAGALQGLRDDGPLGARDIIAVLSVRSDKFLAFVSGAGGFPLDRVGIKQLAGRVGEALARGLGRHLPAALAATPLEFQQGHALMYRDPMLRGERSILRALDEAMLMALRQRTRDEDRHARALDALIAAEQVVTLYQPICDLRDLTVLGHEVFTRGPAGGPFEDPDRLFALAERTGRLVPLERLCRRGALGSVHSHLAPDAKLFLNTSARTLRDPEIAGAGFVRRIDQQGLPHGNVVLEITERAALEERKIYREVLRDLKRQAFLIAIDDMGAGHSSLQSLVDIEPDYLKFDVALVRNIDRSRIKRSLLETLVELAEKIGARVIAEGIEAESEYRTLREMGVQLGQGHFLAPPVVVPHDRRPPT
jgi:EAL domain-containing protein (putative c-di-GMP-specific phosphodiesterase class I)